MTSLNKFNYIRSSGSFFLLLCLSFLVTSNGLSNLNIKPSRTRKPQRKFVTPPAPSDDDNEEKNSVGGGGRRRRFINSCLTGFATAVAFTSAQSQPPPAAYAFDNKISNKYDDRPKQRGGKPKDLGVKTRKDMVGEEYVGLKNCGGAPNCFCSTDNIEDDPDHNIPAWIWPTELGGSNTEDGKEKAFGQLADVVAAYEPGQNNVDGGGFKIIENDAKKGYMYIQFESLKNGYIDDVEFAFVATGTDEDRPAAVQVRSSSRLGYLDYGVNAKRLNYIADKLRQKGWDAKGVDYDKHSNYAILNGLV